MTRTEAKMVAEELYRLMVKNGNIEEKYLNVAEAADYLGVTKSFMYKHPDIPHTKKGGLKYSVSALNEWMNR